LKFIGIPSPLTLLKKYLLVADRDNYDIKLPYTHKKEYFNIEETFLSFDSEE